MQFVIERYAALKKIANTKLEILNIRADLIANGHHQEKMSKASWHHILMRDNTKSFLGSFSCFALSLHRRPCYRLLI